MSYTYSNPSTQPKDAVRFLVGDTNASEPKLQDEEIAFLLTEWDNNTYFAAAAGAEAIAASAASWFSFSGDGVSLSVDQVQTKYMQLATQLRIQASFRGRYAGPYAGGIDRADVERNEIDDSVVHPDFASGMHDNPESGYASGTSRAELLGER